MTNLKQPQIAGVHIKEKIVTQEQRTARQERYWRECENRERRRASAEQNGLPALTRLIEVARRNTGQSQVCGRFLLGLYNGYAFPFNMTNLRRLDESLWDDCISVLKLDQRPKREIHLQLDDGPSVWEELKTAWATDCHQ